MNNTKQNLKNLIGTEFSIDKIIIAFEEEKGEIIVNPVLGQESNFDGYGVCKCYNAYENREDSEVYSIYVSDTDEIVYIK